MIVNRKHECSWVLFSFFKEFFQNDTLFPFIGSVVADFCFALPTTEGCAVSGDVIVTDMKGLPMF